MLPRKTRRQFLRCHWRETRAPLSYAYRTSRNTDHHDTPMSCKSSFFYYRFTKSPIPILRKLKFWNHEVAKPHARIPNRIHSRQKYFYFYTQSAIRRRTCVRSILCALLSSDDQTRNGYLSGDQIMCFIYWQFLRSFTTEANLRHLTNMRIKHLHCCRIGVYIYIKRRHYRTTIVWKSISEIVWQMRSWAPSPDQSHSLDLQRANYLLLLVYIGRYHS
jgi:hypothetical protein